MSGDVAERVVAGCERHYLMPLFEPRSVAIVGATEIPGKIGAGLVTNMLAAGFSGPLVGINPKYRSVHGLPCYPRLAAEYAVDLAVIATPPATVPQLIADCGRADIHHAVVITAGFSETGAAGATLERELLTQARHHGVRLLGPNCLGLLRPSLGLNASFSRGGARPGEVALLSQSGAVCTAMLDWAAARGLGFSSVISLGGSADVGFGETLDYLAADKATRHILMYIEGVRDARRFLGGLRAAARDKNVVLMKVGRHPAGSRAAISHTGAIVGSDDVFDAAIARTGALRVRTLDELTAMGEVLTGQRPARGPRLAVVTNGGGPGVMAADCAGDLQVPLAALSKASIAALQSALPANWSHGNPLDLIGDADMGRYRAAVTACLSDDGVDGVLVMLTPQSLTDPSAIAQAVCAAARVSDKPLLACWMGGAGVAAGRQVLRDAGIAVFEAPERALQAWAHLAALPRLREAQWLAPPPVAPVPPPDLATARAVVDAALIGDRQVVLGAREAKELLAAFHIAVIEDRAAASAVEAAAAASAAGFPAAMKIRAAGLTHKSDVGGVRLGLADAEAVRAAFRDMLAAVAKARPDVVIEGVDIEPMLPATGGRELLVGVTRDRVFGPAITFGAGGTAVEVLRDRSVVLPPLDSALAGRMIDATRVSKLLQGFRGQPPANRDAIVVVLLRVSEMVCALPELAELDINPLVVDAQRAITVDARIVLAPANRALDARAFAHLALPPWPGHLCETTRLGNGAEVELRPIRPEDTEIERAFVTGLSERSRSYRFMTPLPALAPAMLARFTHLDYDRDMAFVAVHKGSDGEVQVGVSRYFALPDGESCEFAVAVADAWQGQGLGQRLMLKIMAAARAQGLSRMTGDILAENISMLSLCRRLGFRLSEADHQGNVRVMTLDLRSANVP